jgi:hypothetical protein
MKTELLSALLIDDEVFRAASLRQTLSLARNRRRWRVGRRAVTGAALVAMMASVFLYRAPVSVPLAVKKEIPLHLVHTAELAPAQKVRTEKGHYMNVRTAPAGLAGLAVIESAPQPLILVKTKTSAPQLDLLSDRQLMAAFPQERPALIAHGTGETRLVFY